MRVRELGLEMAGVAAADIGAAIAASRHREPGIT
jgi:hypothetical protein